METLEPELRVSFLCRNNLQLVLLHIRSSSFFRVKTSCKDVWPVLGPALVLGSPGVPGAGLASYLRFCKVVDQCQQRVGHLGFHSVARLFTTIPGIRCLAAFKNEEVDAK